MSKGRRFFAVAGVLYWIPESNKERRRPGGWNDNNAV